MQRDVLFLCLDFQECVRSNVCVGTGNKTISLFISSSLEEHTRN